MGFFETPEEERIAKAWLHDLTVAAGIKTDNQRKTPLHFTPEFVEHAKILCNELLNRNCNNVDKSIRVLAKYPYNATLKDGETISAQPTPEEIAKYVVFLAKQIDTYWDFRDIDLVRRMDFGETLLGHQVYIQRQYIWMRDLQSDVVHPTLQKIYKIQGDAGNLAQIDPSSPHSNGGTNIVKFIYKTASDTKCTCFFFEQAEAEAFLENLKKSGKADHKNVRVEEQGYANDGGYLTFGTEFGSCVVEKRELTDIWRYKVDCYKNGNPFNRMTPEEFDEFSRNLHRE